VLAVAGADSDSEVPMKVGRRRARRAHGCLDKRACWLGGLSTSDYHYAELRDSLCRLPSLAALSCLG
jgi:hypothetical protein